MPDEPESPRCAIAQEADLVIDRWVQMGGFHDGRFGFR